MPVSKGGKAVLLVGHGSRQRGFQSSMLRVARRLRTGGRFGLVQCAYLEITPPGISEALDTLVRRGARQIRVLPYFVLSGRHVNKHIPSIVSRACRRHSGKAKITLCPYLGFHEKIVEVVKERIGCPP